MFQESLVATVAEMRVTVLRTAFSSIIYEGQDFSCALTDGRGRLLALSREDAPVHVGPMNLQVPAAVEKFRGNLAPGDVLLANDPYTSGTHLNDVLLMAPYFVDGRPFFISCIRAHWGDIGGMTPGRSRGARPRSSRRACDPDPQALRCRQAERSGDGSPVRECPAAARPARRFSRSARRHPHGRRSLRRSSCSASASAQSGRHRPVPRSHRSAHACADREPRRGRVSVRGLHGFGRNHPDPVRVRVSVTVAGSGMTVDFTGSSPQRQGPVNASLAVASTSVFVALKALLDPRAHQRRRLPAGEDRGAAGERGQRGLSRADGRVHRSLQAGVGGPGRCLSRSAPDKITGDIKGSANHVYIGFLGEGDVKSIFYGYPSGGMGGSSTADGSSAVREWDTGDFSSIQSAELVEHEHACLVDRTELRADSAGPGLHRGGLACGASSGSRAIARSSPCSPIAISFPLTAFSAAAPRRATASISFAVTRSSSPRR